MNLADFLVEHAQNNKFSMPDSNFLAEISKRSTKYLIFYDSNCKKSDFLRSIAPKSSRIIKLDVSLDWVSEIYKIYNVDRLPSTAIVKNGSMQPEKIINFNETRILLNTL